jgi:Mg/Co/Ni transporter MgtE
LLNFRATSLNKDDMLDVLIRERTEDIRPGGGMEHNPIFMASLQLHGINCVLF